MKTLRAFSKDLSDSHLTRYSPASNANDLRSGESRWSQKSMCGVLPEKRIPVRESGIQAVDHSQMQELIQHLNVLRSEMLELETSGLAGCAEVHAEHAASAKNLMHYLALRRH